MIVDLLFLISGLSLLVFGADKLIDSSVTVGRRYGLPPVIVGFVVVGFGTSLPELFINIASSVHENSAIVFGNVLGSNVFNGLAILGIGALITPIAIAKSSRNVELPILFLLGPLVLFSATLSRGTMGEVVGLVYLLLFVFFLIYLFITYASVTEIRSGLSYALPRMSLIRILLTLLWAFVMLFGGGELVVNSTELIATDLHVSQHIIALTIVAMGSSLPELMATIVAANRNETGLVVGNIMGSNIFNVLFILGVSFIIHPAAFDGETFLLPILLMMFGAAYLFGVGLLGKDGKLRKVSAIPMLGVYVFYTLYLIVRM